MAARRWWIGSGGDDKLVDAQVSGCQGGLFGCHPSRFLPGTVHYSPCEMPLYIAWWCEQGELNNTGRNQPGPCCSSHSPEGKSLSEGHPGAREGGTVGVTGTSPVPLISLREPRSLECFLVRNSGARHIPRIITG